MSVVIVLVFILLLCLDAKHCPKVIAYPAPTYFEESNSIPILYKMKLRFIEVKRVKLYQDYLTSD